MVGTRRSGAQGDVDVVGSLNCTEWSLLPPATEEMATQTAVVSGRFMGDPSHEYEHTEIQKVNEGEKVFDEEVVVSAGVRGCGRGLSRCPLGLGLNMMGEGVSTTGKALAFPASQSQPQLNQHKSRVPGPGRCSVATVLAALPGDLGSSPSIHTEAHSWISSSKGGNAFF